MSERSPLCQQRSHLCQEGTVLHSSLKLCPQQDTIRRLRLCRAPIKLSHLKATPDTWGWVSLHLRESSDGGADNIWVGLEAGEFTPCAQADFLRRKMMSGRVLSVPFVSDKPNRDLTSNAETSYTVLLWGLWP